MNMSRSGYVEDLDPWEHIRWRGAVASAIKGKRGQALLKEMLASMAAMPVKCLVAENLIEDDSGAVCALGAVGKARDIDMAPIDPEDSAAVAETFGIAQAMAQEIVWINDEAGPSKETPEARFQRVRRWTESQIVRTEHG
jgi:hypothetical protein